MLSVDGNGTDMTDMTDMIGIKIIFFDSVVYWPIR